MTRIPVDPPQSETRRDRVERQVFARLQQMRAADRADAAVPVAARGRGWLVFAAALVAAGAIGVAWIARGGEPVIAEREVPSMITTPAGGTSQFTVGDAVMVAGGDTSVEVKHGDDGGITLVLARGSVDCDVAPRNGRPPFHVISGELAVEVVGTRFTVTRTPAPRVDVTRGKVRVTAPGGSWLVAAGESWSPPAIAVAQQPPLPQPQKLEPEIEIDSTPAAAPRTPVPVLPAPLAPAPLTQVPQPPAHLAAVHMTSQAAFLAAGRLESTEPERAARAFRAVADGQDAWAAPALYALTELHAGAAANRDLALGECAEYLRRFPSDPQAEDVTWLRVEILRTAGRRDEARAAAAEYLRKFPQGSYAGLAARTASPR